MGPDSWRQGAKLIICKVHDKILRYENSITGKVCERIKREPSAIARYLNKIIRAHNGFQLLNLSAARETDLKNVGVKNATGRCCIAEAGQIRVAKINTWIHVLSENIATTCNANLKSVHAYQQAITTFEKA